MNDMPEDNQSVSCGRCNETLSESPNLPHEERMPCPNCGSTNRLFHAKVEGKVTMKSKLRIKGRHSGRGKPFVEAISGDDLHRKSGKWMKFSRLIDRDNDQYHEIVTEPRTGEIVHECKEPLSDHKGYGAAKSKNSKNG